MSQSSSLSLLRKKKFRSLRLKSSGDPYLCEEMWNVHATPNVMISSFLDLTVKPTVFMARTSSCKLDFCPFVLKRRVIRDTKDPRCICLYIVGKSRVLHPHLVLDLPEIRGSVSPLTVLERIRDTTMQVSLLRKNVCILCLMLFVFNAVDTFYILRKLIVSIEVSNKI